MNLFVLDMSVAILSSFLSVVFPLLTNYLLEGPVAQGNVRMMVIVFSVMLGVYVFQAVSTYIRIRWGHILGVRIETDVVVGRTVTVDSLLDEEGYSAVFIGSGAGLPRFMGIPGENLNGVFSANEFLTRNNLMKAYRDDYMTPVYTGHKTVVVGGGNVAMDAARTALRLGAETTIVYRRTEKELPARREEVHHAMEEGITFSMLTNPVEILGDEKGWVRGIRCIKMELGEPDESGRRSPVPVQGSEFDIEADSVIMALGTSPNPLIARTTKGLETNRRGCITADADGATSRPGVFAGGDAVTGAATVILAMGAGRKAAAAIDRYIKGTVADAVVGKY